MSGKHITADYARRRMVKKPLVEIVQAKGRGGVSHEELCPSGLGVSQEVHTEHGNPSDSKVPADIQQSS